MNGLTVLLFASAGYQVIPHQREWKLIYIDLQSVIQSLSQLYSVQLVIGLNNWEWTVFVRPTEGKTLTIDSWLDHQTCEYLYVYFF